MKFLGNITNKELLEILEHNIERLNSINSKSEIFMIEVNKDNFWIVTK